MPFNSLFFLRPLVAYSLTYAGKVAEITKKSIPARVTPFQVTSHFHDYRKKTLQDRVHRLSIDNSVEVSYKDMFLPYKKQLIISGHEKFTNLKNSLRPNMLYIFMHKGILKSPHLEPGHIARFITNRSGEPTPESFISLRISPEGISSKEVIYILKKRDGTFECDKDGNPKKRTASVRKAIFVSFEKEFTEYFFFTNKEQPPLVPLKGMLLGIPLDVIEEYMSLSAEDLIDLAHRTKTRYANTDYILADGELKDLMTKKEEPVKAINCITGFLDSMDVYRLGDKDNPSPQMALWSFLSWLFNDGSMNFLIYELKEQEKGRINDIIIDYKPTEVFRSPRP